MDQSMEQPPPRPVPHLGPASYMPQHKPQGLWVSDEDEYGWSRYAPENLWEGRFGTHAFEITLADDADLLHLSTAEQVIDLNERLGTKFMSLTLGLNWQQVAEEHQGILITPYQHSLRLPMRGPDLGWYYSWDCASGCIWDAKAIAAVTPIDIQEFTRE